MRSDSRGSWASAILKDAFRDEEKQRDYMTIMAYIKVQNRSPGDRAGTPVLEPLCLRGPKCADYTDMKASITIMPNNDEAQSGESSEPERSISAAQIQGDCRSRSRQVCFSKQSTNSVEEAKPKSPTKESPREFIHRRMRELDAPTESATKSRKR